MEGGRGEEGFWRRCVFISYTRYFSCIRGNSLSVSSIVYSASTKEILFMNYVRQNRERTEQFSNEARGIRIRQTSEISWKSSILWAINPSSYTFAGTISLRGIAAAILTADETDETTRKIRVENRILEMLTSIGERSDIRTDKLELSLRFYARRNELFHSWITSSRRRIIRHTA